MSKFLRDEIKDTVMTRFRSAVLLFATCSCLTAFASAESGADRRTVPADQIEFQQIAPFVQMGAAWGDRAVGSHGTFGRFPGDAASPPHTHSGAYYGVVIAGVMTNPFDGEDNPTQMKAGSYWYVPAGVEHVTACVSKESCLFYFHADGAFDFKPVGN